MNTACPNFMCVQSNAHSNHHPPIIAFGRYFHIASLYSRTLSASALFQMKAKLLNPLQTLVSNGKYEIGWPVIKCNENYKRNFWSSHWSSNNIYKFVKYKLTYSLITNKYSK